MNWVGINGYYLNSSSKSAPLFGPTIDAVGALTSEPILIAETGALSVAGQPAKIADLFAGIRLYGLLGFVWFDSTNAVNRVFRINSPEVIASFARGAETFHAYLMSYPMYPTMPSTWYLGITRWCRVPGDGRRAGENGNWHKNSSTSRDPGRPQPTTWASPLRRLA